MYEFFFRLNLDSLYRIFKGINHGKQEEGRGN